MFNVDLTTQALTSVGAVGPIVQNPVQHRDFVYVPRSDNAAVKQVKFVTGAFTLTDLPATAPKARYGIVYKDRLVLGNSVGQEQRLTFSPAGDPMALNAVGGVPAGQWDPISYWNTSLPLSGIAATRAAILAFHAGSVERLRGGIPPTTADPLGDMFMEPLFDRAGCGDARTIAYWQDNASSRTSAACTSRTARRSGTSLRREASSPSGGRSGRTGRRSPPTPTSTTTSSPSSAQTGSRSLSSATCSAGRGSASPTSSRKAFIHSIGAQEQLWGCRSGAKRLIAMSNCFFPTLTEIERDDDGTDVLPVIETPWYRFGDEGRKRVRFAYTSYDVRATLVPPRSRCSGAARSDNEGQVLDPFEENVEARAALAQVLESRLHPQPDGHDLHRRRTPAGDTGLPALPSADLEAPLRHGLPRAADRALLRHTPVRHGRRGAGR